MSQLQLGRYEERPYGHRTKGVVSYGKSAVCVSMRTPEPGVPPSGLTYVLTPGWTADHNTMRFTALEAVKRGHTAITLAHTSKGTSNVIAKNADDIAAVLDAVPKQSRLAVVGHSMGGPTAILGMLKADRQVERATMVAPAKHLLPEYYTAGNVVHSLWDALHEQRSLEGDRETARALGKATLRHCLRRPRAVVAEFFSLMGGTVHDELQQLKQSPDAPYLRIAYGDEDGLFPAHAMEDSIKELPYDDRVLYAGGHCRLNYDPALAQRLIALDMPEIQLETTTAGAPLLAV